MRQPVLHDTINSTWYGWNGIWMQFSLPVLPDTAYEFQMRLKLIESSLVASLSLIEDTVCKDWGQKFLSSFEHKRHQEIHLQTHIDKWSSTSKPDKVRWKAPEGLNPELYRAFEKYRLGDRAMLCLWYNGQLNTAILEPSRILELQDNLRNGCRNSQLQADISTGQIRIRCLKTFRYLCLFSV